MKHRGGQPGVEDAARRRLDVDLPEHAGVGQHVGGHQRLDRVVTGGFQGALDHVEAGEHLRRRFEAQLEVASAYFELQLQRDGLGDLVGVEVLVGFVTAVGYRLDDLADLALGVVEHLLGRLAEGLEPRRLDHALEAGHADEVGGHLRLEVGRALGRHLEVGHQKRERLVDPGVVAADADRRDTDALLEDVVVAALDEVRVVAQVGHEADPRSLVEDRGHEHDVRQVGAPALVDRHLRYSHRVENPDASPRRPKPSCAPLNT